MCSFTLTLSCRTPAAGYCSKIYKLPSDDVNTANKYKEAPIIDNEKVLTDKQTLRERENQSSLISIPVEVNANQLDSPNPFH